MVETGHKLYPPSRLGLDYGRGESVFGTDTGVGIFSDAIGGVGSYRDSLASHANGTGD